MDDIGLIIANILANGYRDVLTRKGKVATRRTINSITPGQRIRSEGVTAYIIADRGLFFIQSGKRANTKLPVRKVSGGFELVPRLKEWSDAVGFGGSDFMLARAIAKKSRAGIDITGQVLNENMKIITDTIGMASTDEIKKQIGAQLRDTFKNF